MKLSLLSENVSRVNQIAKMIKPIVKDDEKSRVVSEYIVEADPTSNKKYSVWIARLFVNGFIKVTNIKVASNQQLILPEDLTRLTDVISSFERLKPRIDNVERDINRYKSFYELEEFVDSKIQAGVTSSSGTITRNIPGAEIVYNDDGYVVYMVQPISREAKKLDYKLTDEEALRVDAVEILGMGPPETKWCTRKNYKGRSMAQYYLALGKSMIVVYKDGKPFIQTHSRQIAMDVNDRAVKLNEQLLPEDVLNAIDNARTNYVVKRRKEIAIKHFNNADARNNFVVQTKHNIKIRAARVVDSDRGFLYLGVFDRTAPKDNRKLHRKSNHDYDARIKYGLTKKISKSYLMNYYDTILTINKNNVDKIYEYNDTMSG